MYLPGLQFVVFLRDLALDIAKQLSYVLALSLRNIESQWNVRNVKYNLKSLSTGGILSSQ